MIRKIIIIKYVSRYLRPFYRWTTDIVSVNGYNDIYSNAIGITKINTKSTSFVIEINKKLSISKNVLYIRVRYYYTAL